MALTNIIREHSVTIQLKIGTSLYSSSITFHFNECYYV